MIIEIDEKTELEYEFLYQFQPTDIHNQIIMHFKGYIEENEKWIRRCNFEASIRARNHLLAMHKLSKGRRAEITSEREETK